MKLIDIHAHLESPRFKDLGKVITDAKKVGVKYIIQSGTDPKRNKKTLEISKKYNIVKPSFGMYPVGNLAKDTNKEIEWIKDHKKECVAIGEIGMDFDNHQRKRHHKEQEVLFKKMLTLAKEIDKPVVIHSRKAEKECIEILKDENMKRVVMHCFCGRKSLIKEAVEAGFYFSVPPAITRWHNFQVLVENVPLKQILTETDSPYLSPEAGQTNEPKNVAVTIKKIAEIKDLTEEEVANQIWKNAVEVFRLEN
jgi:TatD DNase family protein